MDLHFAPEHEAFRQEVRAFLDEKLSEDLREVARRQTALNCHIDPVMRWHRILAEQGWAAPNWPQDYGGPGWDQVQKYIWQSALLAAPAPPLVPTGIGMIGPLLIKFGSDWQKERYLPPLLAGDEVWCQGYSEPGAGSDLSSLKTKCEDKGDHWLVNGSKIWTTYAHHADMIFALVRTDSSGKQQEGIGFLLIDMHSDGVTIDPIISLGDDHELNQVFFDTVKVPKENMVDDPRQGWTYAKYLLTHERGAFPHGIRIRAQLDRIRRMAGSELQDGRPLITDPSVAGRIAEVALEAEALAFTELRITSQLSIGGAPGPEASMLKTKGTEISQKATELAMEVAGYYALAWAPEAFTGRPEDRSNTPPIGPDYAAPIAPYYFNHRAATIYGGSNEIQRDIIAKQVLGL